jgi:photosystem II stability/assembly factor-like uncharacterized protein
MLKIVVILIFIFSITNLSAEKQKGLEILSEKFGVWERMQTPFDSVYALDIIADNDTLFVGVIKHGFLFSTDDGTTWNILSESLIENSTSSPRYLCKNANVFGAILNGNNFFLISSDGGKTWKEDWLGVYSLSNSPINDCAVLDNKFLLSTRWGLKYTTDFGENWNFYKGGDLDSGEIASNIVLDEKNNLYVWTIKGLLKLSDDGGSWKICYSQADRSKNGIYHIIKINSDVIYAINAKGSISKSSDWGKTWKTVGEGLENYYAPHKVDQIEDKLVAVVGGGMLVSGDNGASWEEYLLPFDSPSGAPYLFYNYVIAGDYIIAATGLGILRTKLSDLGITPTSVEAQTERNYLYAFPPYPNPAGGEVKVLFYWDINLPMNVEDISIYDLSGKKIDAEHTLSLEKIGNHYGNLVWDCSATPPGIYLINIKHGTEERTVKVMVE